MNGYGSVLITPQDSSPGSVRGDPVVPTPETQELYNIWQHALESERLQQENGSLTANSLGLTSAGVHGHALLRPPSPSQMTTSSWAGSHVSSTRSLSRGMDEVQSGTTRRSGTDKRPRPGRPGKNKRGRTGPMEDATRAKANLTRKIGACVDCRERRVRCDHLNLELFHQAYEAEKLRSRTTVNNTVAVTTVPALTNQEPLGHRDDLVGVGGNEVLSLQPHATSGTHLTGDEGYTDFDPLQSQQATPDHMLETLLSSFPTPEPQTSRPRLSYSPVSTRPPSSQAHRVPIAKQSYPGSGELICLGRTPASGFLGSLGFSAPSESPRYCHQQFPNLPGWEEHFKACHGQFFEPRVQWRCIYCQNNEESQAHEDGDWCSCGTSEVGSLVMWYWAGISHSPTPTSRTLGLNTSPRGPGSDYSSWASQSPQYKNPYGGGGAGGGYGHYHSPSSGSYGGSYGGGYGGGGYNGGSYLAKAPPSTPNADTACSNLWLSPPLITGSAVKRALIAHGLSTALRNLFLCPVVGLLVIAALAWLSPTAHPSGFLGSRYSRDAILVLFVGDFPGLVEADIVQPSIACMGIGLVASWLVHHVLDRLRQQREAVGEQVMFPVVNTISG
ncbi:uncharacterized protein C8A04DRAFT_12245 [Dichotomopilus funicola]|uniref:Uncharacterized protein n=1 Tax=Dichotomopilus funicola TaxID=1934379 RepID=A0AAN6ZLC8_9PEZI|nr:hypothetical protein C8A04DRAFT_12245 [Dichotomopilus funicola]